MVMDYIDGKILCFWTLSIVLFLPKTLSCFYLKTQRFGDWILCPSSMKPTQLGSFDRASPHLQRKDVFHLLRPPNRLLGYTQPLNQWVLGHLPWGKSVGTWSWSLTFFYCRGYERLEIYLHSLISMHAWRRAQLSTGKIVHLNFYQFVKTVCVGLSWETGSNG
jgi:hypothetical protein